MNLWDTLPDDLQMLIVQHGAAQKIQFALRHYLLQRYDIVIELQARGLPHAHLLPSWWSYVMKYVSKTGAVIYNDVHGAVVYDHVHGDLEWFVDVD